MAHADMTPQAALDALDACKRELARAHEMLGKFVPGAEAARVAQVVGFEVAEMGGAVSVLRKAFGELRDEERVQARLDRGEPARPSVPRPVVDGATA